MMKMLALIQDNRHLYVPGIEPTWTPIKPVTTQFNVGKTKSAPLQLAAAKTYTDHRAILRLRLL